MSKSEHQEFLESIREGGFYDWVDAGKPYSANKDYLDDRYYDHPQWPSPGDPEKKIRSFIDEALSAEKEIVKQLMSEGMEREEAIAEGCQWPLKENAPMEVVHAFLEYDAENMKAKAEGLIID